ncbi:excalibur calcium-binding domain-containing protein [Oerskovia rustica]|uniref:excalibur calcium-binding domain-containing protein n=1 Tax=Oerskovia rustica TaxID=2762237 RepID=UPI001CD8B919|nr:excalibur calcium-binding domain-containing protein [Oerskovia rustica]
MTVRFNPPPGWPTPPEGWTPDPSWTPDPRWPAKPADWPLWVEEPATTEPTEQTMALPVASLAGGGAFAPGRHDGRTRRIVLVAFLCLAFLIVGLLMGAGTSGSRLAAAEATLGEATEARTSLDEDRAALTTAQDELGVAQTDITAREEAVVAKEAELVTRESATVTAEVDLQARLTAVEGREGAVTAAEADLQARSAATGRSGASSSTPKEPTPDAPAGIVGGTGGGAVSYANCDAVRAAGKAPIRLGEPGYSKKLDRDGDGVGCE